MTYIRFYFKKSACEKHRTIQYKVDGDIREGRDKRKVMLGITLCANYYCLQKKVLCLYEQITALILGCTTVTSCKTRQINYCLRHGQVFCLLKYIKELIHEV